jgi:hypothetical protein
LLTVDTRTGRAAPQLDLPVTARGIAFAADEAALLLAARNEIRTFTLPGLTSGPLYRVPGDNVTIAAISGTSRVLVTQGARIVLVDLASPQDREGLPVVRRPMPRPPCARSRRRPPMPRAIALLEGGSTVLIGTEPLGVTPGSPASRHRVARREGRPATSVWPRPRSRPPPQDPAPSPAPPQSEPVAAAPPPDEIQDSVETGPDPRRRRPTPRSGRAPGGTPPVATPPASPPPVENRTCRRA